jgi:hypothetical protein
VDVSPRVDGLETLAVGNQGGTVDAVAVSLDGISDANIVPTVNVAYGLDVDGVSFDGATFALEVVATLADGSETRTEAPLAFAGLVDARTASFTGAAPMAADAVRYSYAVVGPELTGAVPLDAAHAVALSAALPAGEAVVYKRPEVTSAAFAGEWTKKRELALRDVALTLTFDKPVAAADLAKLSLNVGGAVAGAEGSRDLGLVEFGRAEAVDATTVRLWGVSDVVLKDAHAVKLSLASTELPELAAGTPFFVDQAQPGISVLRALPQAEAQLTAKPGGDLPFTGAGGLPLAWLALLSVAVGAALVAWRRRRAPAAER